MNQELIEALEQLMKLAPKTDLESVMGAGNDEWTFLAVCAYSKKSTMPYVTESGDERILYVPGGEGRMNTVIAIDTTPGVLGWCSPEKSIMLVCDGRQVKPAQRVQVRVKGKVKTLYRDTNFNSHSSYYEPLLTQVKLFLQDLTAQETITKDHAEAKAAGEI